MALYLILAAFSIALFLLSFDLLLSPEVLIEVFTSVFISLFADFISSPFLLLSSTLFSLCNFFDDSFSFEWISGESFEIFLFGIYNTYFSEA